MDSEKTVLNAKNPKRSSYICLFAACALAALTTLFYILSFAFSYEEKVCYFVSGAVLPVLARISLGLFIALCCAAFFVFRNENLSKSLPGPRGAHRFISDFVGFVYMFDALYRVKTIVSSFSDQLLYFDRTNEDYDSLRLCRISFILSFFAVAFSIGCALFFLNAAKTTRRNNSMIILGLFPVLRSAAGIAAVYFDMSLAMNIPHKLITEAGLMACVLFFLAEDRLRISDSYAKPALYTCLSLLSAGLCAAGGFSQLFFYIKYSSYYSSIIAEKDMASGFGTIFTEAFLCAVVFLYIISGIVPYLKYDGKEAEAEKAAEDEEQTGESEENKETEENAGTDAGTDAENADAEDASAETAGQKEEPGKGEGQ